MVAVKGGDCVWKLVGEMPRFPQETAGLVKGLTRDHGGIPLDSQRWICTMMLHVWYICLLIYHKHHLFMHVNITIHRSYGIWKVTKNIISKTNMLTYRRATIFLFPISFPAMFSQFLGDTWNNMKWFVKISNPIVYRSIVFWALLSLSNF